MPEIQAPQQQVQQAPQQPVQQPQQAEPVKEIIVEKETVSPVKRFFRLLVTTIIVLLVAALGYGIWWLVRYSLDMGYL